MRAQHGGNGDGVRGYSAQQIRDAEAPLLEAGVPLMQRAADALALEVAALEIEWSDPRRVLLLVGGGDNGGDALFAGARLATSGFVVGIARTSERVHQAGFTSALAAGATEVDALRFEADVAVDGILGIGASGALRSPAHDLVTALNPRFVVAVDLPSGVDTDTGAVAGPVLRADVTVTFGGCKAGLLLEPGASYAGAIRLVEIGLDLTGVTPLV